MTILAGFLDARSQVKVLEGLEEKGKDGKEGADGQSGSQGDPLP